MGSDNHKLGSYVAPGEIIPMAIDMTAPDRAGTYIGYWKMQNPEGNVFGTWFTVKIVVGKRGATATPDEP